MILAARSLAARHISSRAVARLTAKHLPHHLRRKPTCSLGNTAYRWDANNRLIQITSPGGHAGVPPFNASFSYDAFDRRVQANITTAGQPPSVVQHLYEAGTRGSSLELTH